MTISLAFLAPSLIKAAVEGRLPRTGSSTVVSSVVAAGSNFNGVQQTGGASTRHTHTFSWSGTTGGMSANHTHTFTSGVFTTSSTGASEARPEAAVVLSCIRY